MIKLTLEKLYETLGAIILLEENMRKILAVEDDKEINRLICDYLSDSGYATISAENGLDAIRIIREIADLDLVILDLMLPFKSGDMVLQNIREFSDIPVFPCFQSLSRSGRCVPSPSDKYR